jgi:hypothetical protein
MPVAFQREGIYPHGRTRLDRSGKLFNGVTGKIKKP